MNTGYSRSRTIIAPAASAGRGRRAGLAAVTMAAVAQALLVVGFAAGEAARPAVASDSTGTVRADVDHRGAARYLVFFPAGETALDAAGRVALDLALEDHAADRTVTLLARLPEPSAAARVVRDRVDGIRRELGRAGLRVASVLGRPMGPARDNLPPADAVELLVFPAVGTADRTLAAID